MCAQDDETTENRYPTQAEIARDLRCWAVQRAIEIINCPMRDNQKLGGQMAAAQTLTIAKELHSYVMGGDNGDPRT